jgi:hypothetical protein
VLGKDGEAVSVQGESVLHGFDTTLVYHVGLVSRIFFFPPMEVKHTLKPHNGSVGSLEAVDFLLGGGESLRWNDGAERLLHNFPQLVVLLLEQHDGSRGLRVKAARNVLDSLLDDLDDLGVWDRRLGLESVYSAAGADGVEKGGRHFMLCCGGLRGTECFEGVVPIWLLKF